ncbi:MAG: circadian clock KaiB family protein [Alphaproteobacteria bacterium]|uniref:Circadian clock KaiB family protein n=1 Tax=Candidatus Nitrobium versatile TaxID=2884831 RepID=A0A953J5U9_9BACT|nr:circadian clock KaiB family protein [Candidatus Nitrobium versatile]
MAKRKEQTALEDFERALAREDIQFVLRLYVTGATKRSAKAIESIRRICEEYLKGRYELEIIDIYQHPEFAGEEQVIAAPTLVKKLPQPIRKLIGDMSDEDRILIGLGLKRQKETGKAKSTPIQKENVPKKKE